MPASTSILSGIQRRLLVLLLLPLALLALVSAWFDYRAAGSAAVQQDNKLLRLAPLLADSVIAPGPAQGDPPVLLLAPALEEFLKSHEGYSRFLLTDLQGHALLGDDWLAAPVPTTRDSEFHSAEQDGTIYRIVAQRASTSAGELVVYLADGSDARQQWVQALLWKVLLPNLLLVVMAGLAVRWGIARALRPLLELTHTVEQRSPRDLSAIDAKASPDEVRPLVQALNRLFGLVDAQAQAQRRFIADAAHQLRTPLAGLQAQVEAWAQAVQTVQTGAPNPVETAHFEENTPTASVFACSDAITLGANQIFALRDASRRTSQLASQLLALSRADAQSLALQPLEPVDLRSLCESVLALHLDAALAKGIDLGLEAAEAQVLGQAWLLRELLGNLVDNAIAYCPRGSAVTLRCGMRADPVHPEHPLRPFVEVEDNGPGIAPAERSRVLERFYRVPGTVGEGNGLGLAIADEIARVHGATLCLRSARDTGSGPGRGLCASVLMHADKP